VSAAPQPSPASDDVAVIGFPGLAAGRHTGPKLSTVRQPVEAMGERLASELLALIARAGRERAAGAGYRTCDPRIGVIT
jgi:DNA-binding LacI/PurR family transcriptional regulator